MKQLLMPAWYSLPLWQKRRRLTEEDTPVILISWFWLTEHFVYFILANVIVLFPHLEWTGIFFLSFWPKGYILSLISTKRAFTFISFDFDSKVANDTKKMVI